jgi:gliding motility-associated-like protein
MKFKSKIMLAFFALLGTTILQAQPTIVPVPKPSSANWVFDPAKATPAFVQNNGQIDAVASGTVNDPVLFATENTNRVYFTSKGLVYVLSKKTKLTKAEEEQYEKHLRDHGINEEEEKGEGREQKMLRISYVHMQWEGANPNAQIVSESQTSGYWNYLDPSNEKRSINQVRGYSKITYKNLYPGIDIEYTFHPLKGLKYTIYAQPGADLSLIKMKYSGLDKMEIDLQGNLVMEEANGKVKDHAPVTYYGNDQASIISAFELKDHTVSFKLADYDHSRAVVIDPWTVTTFSPLLTPMEIGRDQVNNVYVFGFGGTDHILQKFDALGNFIWSFNMTTQTTGYDAYIGDIAVHPSGEVIVSKGLSVSTLQSGDAKISAAGTLVWNNGISVLMYENWRVIYNCDFTQAINSGCGPGCCNGGRIDLLDQNTGVEGPMYATSIGDMIATCYGQNGLVYSIGVNNFLICLDPNNSFTPVFTLSNNYGLYDGIQTIGTSNLGMNAIAAGCNYLYDFLGTSLERRSLANGTLVNSVTVPNGAFISNSGLAVDGCGNVYAGSADGVYVYDAALTQIGFFSTGTTVMDITIGTGGTIYACGPNFLAQFSGPGLCDPAGITTVAPTSCNTADGSATVSPVFCSAPYTYLWSNGDTTATADSLAIGTYSVIITGGGACNIIDTFAVTLPGAISLAMSQTPTNCNGGPNGTATAIPTGGVAPYTYLWSNNDTTQTITGLIAGTYTVTVTDSSGCITTQSITVTQSVGLPFTASSINPNCFGSNNGTATTNISSGTPPYQYSWNTSPIQTTQTAVGLPPGTYIVTVTDSTGCVGTATVTLTQPTQVIASANGVSVSCNGGNNGTTSASAIGGDGGTYTYLWLISPVQTTQTATNLAAGTYSVIVTDSSGCVDTVSTTITQPPALSLSLSSVGVGCNGGNDGTASASSSGGTPGYSYTWSTIPVQTTANATGLFAGTYAVLVTDANGCTMTQSVTVAEPPPPGDTLTMVGYFCPGDSAAVLYAPPGFSNYQWYFDTIPIAGATSDSLNVNNTGSLNQYSVYWTLNGCIYHTSAIGISPPLYLVNPDSVANVFTPNGDGKNDNFYPFADRMYTPAQLIYYQDSYLLQVYDRWGVLMFETNDYSVVWNGTSNNGNATDGVYYWIVTYKARCSGETQMTEQHGFVHLIR